MSSPLIPVPTSYSPFVYHSGIGSLILVSCTGSPSYNFENLASYAFNGSTWSLISGFPSQSLTNSGPTLRTNTSAAFDGTNLVLWGGKGITPSNFLNDTWLLSSASAWSASSAANTTISTAPQQRASAYMAQESSTSILMFGGVDNQLTFTDASSVFHYAEAGGWTNSVLSFLPPCRLNGSIASDGTSTVLFGFGSNRNGGLLNDLYSWNGSAWSTLTTTGGGTTSGAPSVRHSASFAYNGSAYILFGGANTNNILSDTWSCTSSGAFTQLSLTNSPPARYGAQMAYLPGTGIILTGGLGTGSYPMTDTWLLAGSSPSTWQRLF